nr:MAG TPA: hypothetical protein [Bacteriophage sp.]
MNVKESNLLTNHPSQIDKHTLESFYRCSFSYSSDMGILDTDMLEILNIYYLSRHFRYGSYLFIRVSK